MEGVHCRFRRFCRSMKRQPLSEEYTRTRKCSFMRLGECFQRIRWPRDLAREVPLSRRALGKRGLTASPYSLAFLEAAARAVLVPLTLASLFSLSELDSRTRLSRRLPGLLSSVCSFVPALALLMGPSRAVPLSSCVVASLARLPARAIAAVIASFVMNTVCPYRKLAIEAGELDRYDGHSGALATHCFILLGCPSPMPAMLYTSAGWEGRRESVGLRQLECTSPLFADGGRKASHPCRKTADNAQSQIRAFEEGRG